jgi:hypothetical protein
VYRASGIQAFSGKAASAAYIVALGLAIKTPGREPEREKEVAARLKQLLQSNPDESQQLAVWSALMTNNDRKNLDLVATVAIRFFPANSTFEERKLQSHSVGSLRYDGQTGS